MSIPGMLLISLALAQDPGQAKIDEWILNLGAEEIEAREGAQGQLLKIGAVAAPSLRKAAEDHDLERAYRARAILARIEPKKNATLGKPVPASKAASDDEDSVIERSDPASGRILRVRFRHLSVFDAWFWPFWRGLENTGG
jgi:hypothetical protein